MAKPSKRERDQLRDMKEQGMTPVPTKKGK